MQTPLAITVLHQAAEVQIALDGIPAVRRQALRYENEQKTAAVWVDVPELAVWVPQSPLGP